MRARSVTARSSDGVVEVTVGANGHAAGIHFVDKRFRGMAAPQLGDSALKALTTARAEVAARAVAGMTAANLLPALPAQPVPGGEPTRSRPQGPLWGRRPSLRTSLPPGPPDGIRSGAIGCGQHRGQTHGFDLSHGTL
jgi:hypothetical protein